MDESAENLLNPGRSRNSWCHRPPGVGDDDLLAVALQDSRYGGSPGRAVSPPSTPIGEAGERSIMGARREVWVKIRASEAERDEPEPDCPLIG